MLPRSRDRPLHQPVCLRLSDDLETMPLVERSDGIPPEVFETDRQPQRIGRLRAVHQGARSKSRALACRDQVEFAESNKGVWSEQ